MVHIIQPQATYGQALGESVGGGLSNAFSNMLKQKQERQKLQDIMSLIKPPSSQGQGLGQSEGTPQPQDDFHTAIALSLAGQPELAKIITERGKTQRKEGFARESAAEPELLKIENKLRSTEASDLRQEKLQNLFSAEKESQFPSSTLAAVFTKDGELNDIALSQLSPDAQESIKLLADEVQGVKDTFGSQITGFEVRSFMKRLPSLLNTPEGKRRVIRDLRLMNKINRAHDEGILNIIENRGGPSKVSISQAERIYRKENAPKIKQMREEFLHPEKTEFAEMPDASMYAGRILEDPETGQTFISNGKSWIPQ